MATNHQVQLLYDEKKCPDNFPNTILCYNIDKSGQKVSILGENISLSFDLVNMSIMVNITMSFWFVDCYQHTMSQYTTNFGVLDGEIVDFYMISKYKGVLLEFSIHDHTLRQHLFTFNHRLKTGTTEFYRSWKFESRTIPKAGLGNISNGTLVIFGYGPMNDLGIPNLILKTFPADPIRLDKSVDLSIQANRLRDIVERQSSRERRVELWFQSQPLVNQGGIHFLLAYTQINDERFPSPFRFEFSILGYISFDSNLQPSLINVIGPTIEKQLSSRLFAHSCPMVIQAGEKCWIPLIIAAHPLHWRFQLQNLLNKICRASLLFIGFVSITFGKYDGGLTASFLSKIYRFVFGNQLIPDVTPSPTLVPLLLDIDSRKFSLKSIEIDDKFLRSGQLFGGVTNDGRALFCELLPRERRLCIMNVPNDKTPTLLTTLALLATFSNKTENERKETLNEICPLGILQSP